MDSLDKINIYLPPELKAQIERDAMLFEILKKDRRTVNMNRFMSLLLCGYYDNYLIETRRSFDLIQNILKQYNLSDTERTDIADGILKGSVSPSYTVYRSKNSASLSLKPTKETIPILATIERELAGRDSLSQYIRRMLISYCQKAIWEREQIIFHDNYQFISEHCERGL